MFEFSVNRAMEKRITMRISTHLLAYLLTSIVKELKISVEHGRVVTTLNIIVSEVNGEYYHRLHLVAFTC